MGEINSPIRDRSSYLEDEEIHQGSLISDQSSEREVENNLQEFFDLQLFI